MPPNQSGEIAGQPSNLANAKVGPADFVLLRVVGQGAFGKVLFIYFTNRYFKRAPGPGVHPQTLGNT